jgi:outer membrane protein assembly factor BamB
MRPEHPVSSSRSRAGLPACLAVLALALGACAPTAFAGREPPRTELPTPTASASSRGPLSQTLTSYPRTPDTQWSFGAGDADLTPAATTVTDPSLITSFVAGRTGAAPVNAQTVWVVAVTGGRPPTLVGLAQDTGRGVWTYAPARGQLVNCAGRLAGDHLLCAVTSGGERPTYAVVALDPGSGRETGRFDLPFEPTGLRVADGDLLVLMRTAPDLYSRTPLPANPYRVARYTVAGVQVWTRDIPFAPTAAALAGPASERILASSGIVGVEIRGSVYVLDRDDGAVRLQRPNAGATFVAVAGGALLDETALDADGDPQSVRVTVLDGEGGTLATLERHGVAPSLLHSERGSQPLVVDASGQLARLDPATGKTTGTGVAVGSAQDLEGASVIGDLLVVDNGVVLAAYSADTPGPPLWQAEPLFGAAAFSDGTDLYAIWYDDDAGTTSSLYGLRLADGSEEWRLPIEPGSPDSPAVLDHVGDRLVLISNGRIAALVP